MLHFIPIRRVFPSPFLIYKFLLCDIFVHDFDLRETVINVRRGAMFVRPDWLLVSRLARSDTRHRRVECRRITGAMVRLSTTLHYFFHKSLLFYRVHNTLSLLVL